MSEQIQWPLGKGIKLTGLYLSDLIAFANGEREWPGTPGREQAQARKALVKLLELFISKEDVTDLIELSRPVLVGLKPESPEGAFRVTKRTQLTVTCELAPLRLPQDLPEVATLLLVSPIANRLGRCALPRCGRFFVPHTPRREAYCVPEHRAEGRRIATAERVRRLRSERRGLPAALAPKEAMALASLEVKAIGRLADRIGRALRKPLGASKSRKNIESLTLQLVANIERLRALHDKRATSRQVDHARVKSELKALGLPCDLEGIVSEVLALEANKSTHRLPN